MPRIRIGYYEKKVILKIIVFFVLLGGVFLLNLLNHHNVEKNLKMVKFIKNEQQYTKDNNDLKKRSLEFEQYLLKINPGTDLDNQKSRYMNMILELLIRFRIKADSYDSKKIKENGFVMFNYVVSAFGSYVDIIHFLLHLRTKFKFMFIRQVKMNKTGANLVRIDLGIDVIGKE